MVLLLRHGSRAHPVIRRVHRRRCRGRVGSDLPDEAGAARARVGDAGERPAAQSVRQGQRERGSRAGLAVLTPDHGLDAERERAGLVREEARAVDAHVVRRLPELAIGAVPAGHGDRDVDDPPQRYCLLVVQARDLLLSDGRSAMNTLDPDVIDGFRATGPAVRRA